MDDHELGRYVKEAFRLMDEHDRHPALEEIAHFARGESSEPAREELERHLAGCELCRQQLHEFEQFLADCDNPPASDLTSEWRELQRRIRARKVVMLAPKWGSIAAGLALVCGLGYVAFRMFTPSTASLLAQARREQPNSEYRIAGADYAPVSQQRAGRSAFGLPPSLFKAEARLADQILARPGDPEVLRLQGEAEMIARDAGNAVNALRKALDARPQDPRILADLGAAYALRGEVENQFGDYTSALEYLSQSLRLQPRSPEPAFNRALVLERLLLKDQAIRAWESYLKLDSSSLWAREARKRLLELQQEMKKRAAAVRGILEDPEKFLAAASAPLDAEAYLTRVAVVDWLPRAAASEPSRQAVQVLATLLKQRNRDSWLADVAASGWDRHGTVGFAQLSEARKLNQSGSADSALQLARQAQASFRLAANQPALLWARYEEVLSLHNLIRSADCLELARRLRGGLESRAYPWLRSRAQIEIGVCAMRLGKLGEADAALQRAVDSSEAAGLGETSLRARNMYLDCLRDTGRHSAYLIQAHAALHDFWSGAYPAIHYQQTVDRLKEIASEAGQQQAALWLARSALWAALERPKNKQVEEAAQAGLAVAAQAADEPDESRSHLEIANLLVANLPAAFQMEPGIALAWLDLDRHQAAPALRRLEKMRRAVETDATISIEIDFAAALGEAYRQSGALGPAIEAYRKSIEKGAQQLASLTSERDRAGVLQTIQTSARGLVAATLATAGPADALREWRKFRQLDALAAAGRQPAPADAQLSCIRLPGEYACWLARGDRMIAFNRIAADLRDVDTVAARLHRETSAPSDPDLLRKNGRRLYQWIVQPFAAQLGGETVLSFELDGGLAALPVSVLVASDGAYLGERIPIVLDSGSGAKRPDVTRDAHVLVIANAAATGASVVDFPPLPDSLNEAEVIRAAFRATSVFEGREATLDALAQFLPHVEIVHFAGHGYVSSDPVSLLMAPRDSSHAEYELVGPEEIRKQDWSRCRLVVLSACGTAPDAPAGPMNPESLVRSLLHAGAARVVASLWNVDSKATAEFMGAFFRSIAQGQSAAVALRAAQRTVKSHPEWSHPYYWAAFQLYGAA